MSVAIEREWAAWLKKLRQLPTRDGVRAALVTCNLFAAIWPESLRDDLSTNVNCLTEWIACPCERHARACADRIGRNGFAPLADENFPLALEVAGVVFSPAAEHAYWAVEEALMAAASQWFPLLGDHLSAASHVERSVQGALESLRLASPSASAPHRLVMDALRAELSLEIEVEVVTADAPAPPVYVETRFEPIAPRRVVTQASARELAASLAAALFPTEAPREAVVDSQDKESVGYSFYRLVVEWRSQHIVVVWTYQRERYMGVDTDDVLTIDVDGSRVSIDEGRLEIDPAGPHADALKAVLDAWLAASA